MNSSKIQAISSKPWRRAVAAAAIAVLLLFAPVRSNAGTVCSMLGAQPNARAGGVGELACLLTVVLLEGTLLALGTTTVVLNAIRIHQKRKPGTVLIAMGYATAGLNLGWGAYQIARGVQFSHRPLLGFGGTHLALGTLGLTMTVANQKIRRPQTVTQQSLTPQILLRPALLFTGRAPTFGLILRVSGF